MRYEDVRSECLRLNRNMVSLRCTSDDECPICVQPLYGRPVYVTACGHTWHLSCQRKCRSHKMRRCCICRAHLAQTDDEADADADVDAALWSMDIPWRELLQDLLNSMQVSESLSRRLRELEA